MIHWSHRLRPEPKPYYTQPATRTRTRHLASVRHQLYLNYTLKVHTRYKNASRHSTLVRHRIETATPQHPSSKENARRRRRRRKRLPPQGNCIIPFGTLLLGPWPNRFISFSINCTYPSATISISVPPLVFVLLVLHSQSLSTCCTYIITSTQACITSLQAILHGCLVLPLRKPVRSRASSNHPSQRHRRRCHPLHSYIHTLYTTSPSLRTGYDGLERSTTFDIVILCRRWRHAALHVSI